MKIKGLSNSDLPFEARYNIAPGQTILAIADFGHGAEVTSFVWVLFPRGVVMAKASSMRGVRRLKRNRVLASRFRSADV